MRWLIVGLLAAGAAAAADANAALRYITGAVASEDLVRIPDTDWLIASGMNVGRPAHLYLIDTVHKSASILFPVDAAEHASPTAADRRLQRPA